MSGTLFLAGADNPGPALAAACLNLFVALALVSISGAAWIALALQLRSL